MGNQRVLSSTERHTKHTENNTTVEYAPLSLLQDCLIHVKKWLQKTYNLFRTDASETLYDKYVIVPADKASSNIVFVCKS